MPSIAVYCDSPRPPDSFRRAGRKFLWTASARLSEPANQLIYTVNVFYAARRAYMLAAYSASRIGEPQGLCERGTVRYRINKSRTEAVSGASGVYGLYRERGHKTFVVCVKVITSFFAELDNDRFDAGFIKLMSH